ncbi:MAG: acyl-[acyl-carrier-protein]--UDP-N-acetylglucosamine O-acyltransferase, partial [Candidatus Margulisbacteria bacterium]|nr:acyl-[acyl-carrier-protein]--UDP-N-acetylglucosamine O-acyltransferase [Candidatus Margulisiibacteriota bacterium]
KMAMIGGYSKVNQDVPPFMLVEGNPAIIRTLNTIGMERNNVGKDSVSAVKKAYRILFRSKMNLSQAIEKVLSDVEQTPEVSYLLDFLKSETKNGIMRTGKDQAEDNEAE